MKKFATLFCLVCLIVAGGIWVASKLFGSVQNDLGTAAEVSQLAQLPDRSIVRLQIGEQQFEVEVVNTVESITQGLSGRSEIGRDGMLFILPERNVATFWMYDMHFDLDLIWIDGHQVVGVTERAQAPEQGVSPDALPRLAAPSPITMVLEIPAGVAQTRGIQSGSTVAIIK